MTRLSDEELTATTERARNGWGIDAAATLALLDEITRLRAERDEAYRRGAEAMRECVIDFFDRNKVYSGLEVRELVRGYLFDPSKGGE